MAAKARDHASLRESREAVLRGFKRHLLDKGHDETEWALMASESDVDASFRKFMNCGVARDEALIQACVGGVLKAGRLLLCEVYDNSGHPQGEAVIEFIKDVSASDGFMAFEAKHIVASDEGYQSWAKFHLADTSKALYHNCGCHAWECGWTKRGRKVIHISKWRVTSLEQLCLIDWSSAIAFGLLRDKIVRAPKSNKRKVGKQPPQGSLPAQPPKATLVSDVERAAETQAAQIQDALRSGRPGLLEDADLDFSALRCPEPEEPTERPGKQRRLGVEPVGKPGSAPQKNVHQVLTATARGWDASKRKNVLEEISSDLEEIKGGVAHGREKRQVERGRTRETSHKKRRRHRRRSSSSSASSHRSSASSVLPWSGRREAESLAVRSKDTWCFTEVWPPADAAIFAGQSGRRCDSSEFG